MRPTPPLSARAALLAAACLSLALGQRGGDDDAPEAPGCPTEVHDEGYVGSAACEGCHADNHASWHASYHRRMTQAASPEAVLAPFEGSTPALAGTAYRLEREGEAFFVTPTTPTGDPSGPRQRVVMTTGSHHYQIYWLEGRSDEGMERLPFVWHLAERAWVPRAAMFLTPPFGIEDETGRWQKACIKCHTTNGTRRHPSDGAPHAAELGISCEACHGPGEAHALLRRAIDAGEAAAPLVDETIVVPDELPHDKSAQVCGQCHGVTPFTTNEQRRTWAHEGFAYRPGDDLLATRELLRGRVQDNSPKQRALLRASPELLPSLFWSDGEVRVSGREYNGLVESPCFQRGEMACVSCHELHADPEKDDLVAWASDQLGPGMDGPNACLTCHGAYSEPAKLEAHAHHPPGSSGANCLNCHMPYTVYGLTKTIRSHTITSPSAAASAATGRPNACNLCHLDRSLGWAADRLAEWYGHARPELGRDDEELAAPVLWTLRGDAGLRAIAGCALGWAPAREVSGSGWMPPLLSTLLMDPYDAVRWIAQRTTRLDPRWKDLSLDFAGDVEQVRTEVRRTVLAEWMRDGLAAPPERRAALLIRDDGSIDAVRFDGLFAQRDLRPVRLAE